MKTCTKCEVSKPLSEFYRHKGMKDGITLWCGACQLRAAKAYYERNRERLKVRARARYGERKSLISVQGKRQRDGIKDQVFAQYGGYRCSCCGESEKSFLTIDHTTNDGNTHRKTQGITTGSATYYWLRRNGYPKGFAVLCWNCNVGKHRNKGICPHAEKEIAKAA